MEYREQKHTAALKHAEPQFDSQDSLYKESVDGYVKDFEAGADWAEQHERASYEQAEKAALEYASQCVPVEDVDAITTPFMEGVEWYHIEITKKWSRKTVFVNGIEGYQIEENPSGLRKFFSSTAGEILIAVIAVTAIVLVLLL